MKIQSIKRRSWLRWSVLAMLFCLALISAWILWSPWPDPQHETLPWTPDVIVGLGGGDEARSRKCLELATSFPQTPIVITGDGGLIVQFLRDHGVPKSRIIHENLATSTFENAHFTKDLLDELHGKQVVLVTNWFHAPRSLAMFRTCQPERRFAVVFESKPEVLTPWDKGCMRRERIAVLYYFLIHGISSF